MVIGFVRLQTINIVPSLHATIYCCLHHLTLTKNRTNGTVFCCWISCPIKEGLHRTMYFLRGTTIKFLENFNESRKGTSDVEVSSMETWIIVQVVKLETWTFPGNWENYKTSIVISSKIINQTFEHNIFTKKKIYEKEIFERWFFLTFLFRCCITVFYIFQKYPR